MSKVYDPREHSYVTFKDDCQYPREILWCDGDFVIISANYSDDIFDLPDVEELTRAFDSNGNKLLQVNVERVLNFFSSEDAQELVELIEADARLYSYAR